MLPRVGPKQDVIKVKGRIRIGQLRELKEYEPVEDRPEYDIDYVEDSVLPPHLRQPLRRPFATRWSRGDFRYEFQPTGRDVTIADDGLTLQYGILGGPGSGKTNLLIYLLRQIIAHHA